MPGLALHWLLRLDTAGSAESRWLIAGACLGRTRARLRVQTMWLTMPLLVGALSNNVLRFLCWRTGPLPRWTAAVAAWAIPCDVERWDQGTSARSHAGDEDFAWVTCWLTHAAPARVRPLRNVRGASGHPFRSPSRWRGRYRRRGRGAVRDGGRSPCAARVRAYPCFTCVSGNDFRSLPLPTIPLVAWARGGAVCLRTGRAAPILAAPLVAASLVSPVPPGSRMDASRIRSQGDSTPPAQHGDTRCRLLALCHLGVPLQATTDAA